MVVVDLFSGAGGLTEGFKNEGSEIVAHIEKEKWACETLKTRCVYHFLKSVNDLHTYNEYLVNSNSYLNLEADRQNIFYRKYPELKTYFSKFFYCPAFLQAFFTDSCSKCFSDIYFCICFFQLYHPVSTI
ncbi:MAG: DNA cytosine methyltransferase [Clostridiales bacterium]|jgi:DNA (cytosine-5)-methyltransferase 1|nr:DNA cytosine methyltransferase [Eubacteriales bacterium]MDH7567858.1 DNA cytosine methyltransferase [Clostridiales bacterium]